MAVSFRRITFIIMSLVPSFIIITHWNINFNQQILQIITFFLLIPINDKRAELTAQLSFGGYYVQGVSIVIAVTAAVCTVSASVSVAELTVI